MPKKLFAAEVMVKEAPPSVLEILRMKSVPSPKRLRKPLDEMFILSNENQFVIYGVGDSIDGLMNFFLKDERLIPYVRFYKDTEVSLFHLFASASGLCSPLIADETILSDLRKAQLAGLKSGHIGLILHAVIDEAIRVGQKMQTDSELQLFPVIHAEAGVNLVFEEVDSPLDARYLVLGTSRIAEKLLHLLHQEGVTNCVVASDDVELAASIGYKYGYCAISRSALEITFQHADVVIADANEKIRLTSRDESALRDAISSPDCIAKTILYYGMLGDGCKAIRDKTKIRFFDLPEIRKFNTSEVLPNIDEVLPMIREEAAAYKDHFDQLVKAIVLCDYWNRKVKPGDYVKVSLQRLKLAEVEEQADLVRNYSEQLISKKEFDVNTLKSVQDDTPTSLESSEMKSIVGIDSLRFQSPLNNN